MSQSSSPHPPRQESPSRLPVTRRMPLERRMPVNMLLVENRIRQFMEHSTRYAFKSEARLAKDCGVSDAAICRLLIGYSSPSFAMLCKLTEAFEKEFKKKIDPCELASIDGNYPTPTVCEIVGCKGCTPQSAWNGDDTLKPEYSNYEGKQRQRSQHSSNPIKPDLPDKPEKEDDEV